jgi:hypothetical protein
MTTGSLVQNTFIKHKLCFSALINAQRQAQPDIIAYLAVIRELYESPACVHLYQAWAVKVFFTM